MSFQRALYEEYKSETNSGGVARALIWWLVKFFAWSFGGILMLLLLIASYFFPPLFLIVMLLLFIAAHFFWMGKSK